MPRNGVVPLNDATVVDVTNRKTGLSRVVATKGAYTITIERNGAFPDSMELRPDDTIDVVVSFDPRVKA